MKQQRNQKDELSQAVARLKTNALAVVYAVIGGMGLWVMTVWLVTQGGPPPWGPPPTTLQLLLRLLGDLVLR
jgi:hypothetical protein